MEWNIQTEITGMREDVKEGLTNQIKIDKRVAVLEEDLKKRIKFKEFLWVGARRLVILLVGGTGLYFITLYLGK